MKNNYLFLLIAIACFTGKAAAQQRCYSDEVRRQLITAHPELLQMEADYEQQISNALKKIDYTKAARTTATDQAGNEDFWYDIPVVVHIIHDYGVENITDNNVFNYLIDWNIVYAKQNADTSEVTAPYKGLISNSNVRYIGN